MDALSVTEGRLRALFAAGDEAAEAGEACGGLGA